MMCAFMTPVLKNDWEVHNVKRRTRGHSESSSRSVPSSHRSFISGGRSSRAPLGERSLSYHIDQRPEMRSHTDNARKRALHLSMQNSRCESKASFSQTNSGLTSPTKQEKKQPTRSYSTNSLNKFHDKVMNKLQKIKNALHIKDNSEDNESQKNSRPQSPSEKSPSNSPQELFKSPQESPKSSPTGENPTNQRV